MASISSIKTTKKDEKRVKPSVRMFVRGMFPKPLEEILVQNWNVLPLRIFDECRKQGVRFIKDHKNGISFMRISKSMITRTGIRLILTAMFEATLDEKDIAYTFRLRSDSGNTLIALADEFEFEDKTARIAFVVESDECKNLDQISEFRERLLSDLTLFLTSIQDILQQKELEITLDVISTVLLIPEGSRISEAVDVKPLITWLQRVFGIPKSDPISFGMSRLNFDWGKDGAKYDVSISEDTLQFEISDINIKGESLTISRRVNSLMADEYQTLQNIRKMAIA